MSNYRCGKLPPKLDKRTLKLGDYLIKKALPPTPSEIDWTPKVQKWGMLANDQIGDCAIASPMHQIMAMKSLTGESVVFTDDDAIRDYSAITGYVPGNSRTDNGTVMKDMLDYWRKVGFKDQAGKYHKILAYVSIDVKNIDEINFGLFGFGGIQLGIQLPKAAQKQLDAGQSWTGPVDPRQARNQWAPGSWGGHAIPLMRRNSTQIGCITWGKIQLMSGPFFVDYADEAYAVVTEDWVNANGSTPSGLNLSALWDDLSAVTDGRVPTPTKPNFPPPTPIPTPVPPPPPIGSTKLTVSFDLDFLAGIISNATVTKK